MSAARASGAGAELWPGDAQVMLDGQTEVLELIALAAPLSEVLEHILRSLEALMPEAQCSVLLLDRERRTLHHGAAPSLPQEYVAAIDGMAIGDGAGSCGTAACTNAAVVARDVRTDPLWVDFRDLAAAAGVRSCWSTPIEGRDGLPVGTFAVYHRRPQSPSGREQLLVDQFTHLASVAIDHAAVLGDLVESEERFRRSFDDNSMGMAIVGLDGRVLTSNTALTELGRRDLSGSNLADLLAATGRPLRRRLEELGSRGGPPTTFEAVLHRPPADDCSTDDDLRLDVEVTVSLLRSRDGEPAQYVVNVFDLTERRAGERERRGRLEAETARRTAEELSHRKSEVLAAVGHEARTPIQAIVGFAELLATMELDESRRQEALTHIGAAAGHVMDLLADVLDLSRLEARALPLALQPMRLCEVVEEAFALLSASAARREVELWHDDCDETVLADRRRLLQVLLNLVTNAIRHGNAGGRVEVRRRPPREAGCVVVSVTDDGPGIPADLLPRVFTPFACAGARAGGSAVATAGDGVPEESFGLGLGLAHGLMAAMGGDLSVGDSTPTGTTMLLRVPAARAPST